MQNSNLTQAENRTTYPSIYPIISHDTEEYNPVNEDILEDTEAKAANISEEETAALLEQSGAAMDAILLRTMTRQYTAGEKAKMILAGDIAPTSPTQQTIIDKVNESIKAGIMSYITADKLQNGTERAVIQARILNALNLYRAEEVKKAGEEAAAITQGDSEAKANARRAAEKAVEMSMPVFKSIPFSTIAALLEATNTVRVFSIHENASYDEKQLIYREYMNGKPTIWRTISKTGIHNNPLVEIAAIIGDLNPDLSNTGKFNIIGYLMRSENVLIQDTSITTQGNYIWALNGIIDLSRVKWTAPANKYLTPEGKVFDFYEYGSEKAEELAFTSIPLRIWRRSVPCVDNLPCPDKYNEKDGTHWNPIDGIKELFHDNEQYKAQLVFYIIQGAIRGTNYGRGFIFKDATEYAGGGNGKSTVALIIEYLLGMENILNRSIAEYEEDNRQLDGLESCMAVISAEMPAGSKAYKGDKFKELCRQEGPISYDRKYKSPMTTFFRGPVIQCTNPKGIKFKDESDSMHRKYEVVEFSKCFAKKGQQEREYIKSNYIRDKEVLDYLAWYCLTQIPLLDLETGFPAELLDKFNEAKQDFIKDTKIVWKFWDDMLTPVTYTDEEGQTETYRKWKHDIIPLAIAEEIYKQWARDNGYSTVQSENFRNRTEQYIGTLNNWKFFDTYNKVSLKAVEKNNPLPEVSHMNELFYKGKPMTEYRHFNETEEGYCYTESMTKRKYAGYILYTGA